MNNLYTLAITQLEGGNYTIDTVLNAIKTVTDWAISIGIALAGLTLVIGFIVFAVVDVEQKVRARQKITQVLLGIGGIVLSISLVNIMIRLFV
ncbi:MAG: hypothetical protein IJY25_03905 [Bacilli bacterium]|nr:hypothetical protein [Bacilli bacterium]MBQ9072278.1 hypothetical protein [Bacilli bacterium]